MGKRGPKPRKNVRTQWSSELAYAVGLIATDGCLSKDGRHIDFTSKDRELIIVFRECLNLKNKIGRKTRGGTKTKDYYRIQFGDVHFYKWLNGIGLSSHKSKSIGRLRMPSRYFFDFLRGCFDGDGSMYAYWDPRWRSSYMFYMQFASASLPFLLWLQDEIGKRLTIGKIDYSLGSTAYQLRFAKKGTIALFNKMFSSKDIPLLKRKFVKAQRIFRVNDMHNNARVAKLVNASS